jgi:hypothetical protein
LLTEAGLPTVRMMDVPRAPQAVFGARPAQPGAPTVLLYAHYDVQPPGPDEELLQSQYAWQLGTAGPASRPVILDPDFVKAAEIFVSVYAPEKLAGFQEFVSGLELEETTD